MFLLNLANTLMHRSRMDQHGHSLGKHKGNSLQKGNRLSMRLSPRAKPTRPNVGGTLAIGIAIGALVGFKLRHKQQESLEMPRANLWRAALVEKYGPVVAEVILANMEARYRQLMLRQPHFTHPALRSHFERGIAPGMSLYQTLREQCDNPTAALNDATDLIAGVARRSARQQQIQLLKYLPNAFGVLRLFTRLMMRQAYPSVGWDIQWLEDSDKSIAFNISRCFYQDVLKAYGVPELTPVFCKGDDEMFKALPPGITWERTGTLALGNAVCDFCWRNKTALVTPITTGERA